MKHILLILLLLCGITVSAQEHEIAAPNCALRTKPTPGIDAYCKICGEKQQKERLAKQKAEEQKLASLRANQKAANEQLAAERTQQKQALENKLKSGPKEGMILAAPSNINRSIPAPVKEITYSAEDKELLALAAKEQLKAEVDRDKIILWSMSEGQRTNLRTMSFVPEPDKRYSPRPFVSYGYALVLISKKNKEDYYSDFAHDVINIKGEFLVNDTTVKQILPCGEKWVLLMRQTKRDVMNRNFNETDKLELYNLHTKERIPFSDDIISTNTLKIDWFANSRVVQLPLVINNRNKLWGYKILKADNAINLTAVWDLKKMSAAGEYFCKQSQPMPGEVKAGLTNNDMLFLILIHNGGTFADFATYGFNAADKKLSLVNRVPAKYTSLLSDWFAEICK